MKFRVTAKLKPGQISDQRNALRIHRPKPKPFDDSVHMSFPKNRRPVGHNRGYTARWIDKAQDLKFTPDRPDGADRVRPFANKQRMTKVRVRKPYPGPSGTSH